VENSLGGKNEDLATKDKNSPITDSRAYLTHCLAVTAPNLLSLQPVMARPPGSSFLGASASIVPCKLGSIDAVPKKAVIDSGSDITLISLETYNSIDPKPKIRTGKKIKLITVTGNSIITGFVQLDVYFDATGGPVKMPLEAYVVKGMNADFILGNDYADQFRLSIVRNGAGTRLTFGDSDRHIDIDNSVDEEGTRAFTRAAKTRLIRKSDNPRSKAPAKDPNYVRVKEDVIVPANTVKLVPIVAAIPDGFTDAYVESIELLQRNLEGSIHLIESIISNEENSLLIANSSSRPLKLSRGEAVGVLRNPNEWLDSRENASEELVQAVKATHAVSQLYQRLARPTPGDLDAELHESVLKPQGGPKTAESPDPEPIPSSRLLQEIQFSPNLSPDQRQRLETVILQHAGAFGLDGRLGEFPSHVEIHLKEGARPISLPPYNASPMRRGVINEQMDVWIAAGVIEASNSPWGFPVLIVFRNGKPRLCVDFRKLNECKLSMAQNGYLPLTRYQDSPNWRLESKTVHLPPSVRTEVFTNSDAFRLAYGMDQPSSNG
jgi:hypothetical protein